MWGAAAMSLSSFTVCMNALRLNLFRLRDASHDHPMRKRALPPVSVPDQTAAAENLYKKSASKAEVYAKEDSEMKETAKIEGMMCGHCEMHVKQALEALDGVESAVVSKDSGTAEMTLTKPVEESAVRKAVEDAGYQFKGIA